MSLLLAGSVGLVVFEAARARLQERRALIAAVAAAGLLWQPFIAAGVIFAGAAVLFHRRLAERRLRNERTAADVPLLAELTQLGLTAGIPFAAALQAAAEEVDDALAGHVRRVLRRARRTGLAIALQEATGPGEQLFRLAARATATGAPLAGAVAAFVEEGRHAERAARMAAARRLPVRLLLPLALLILPGFVLLTLGPALLGAIQRLEL